MKGGVLDGMRLLVVEDETPIAFLVEDMVSELGGSVVASAARVKQALVLVDAAGFDLALLDVNVAGDEIYPVAEQLAARGIPFVFATGYGTGGLRAEWRNRPTVAKPFSIDALGRAFGAALGR